MTDFLQRLAERALGEAPTVQPLIPSFYAPLFPERQGAESGVPADAVETQAFSEGRTLRAKTLRAGRRNEPGSIAAKDAEAERRAAPSALPPKNVEPILPRVQAQEEEQRAPEVKTHAEHPRIIPAASGALRVTPGVLTSTLPNAPTELPNASGNLAQLERETEARVFYVPARPQAQVSATEGSSAGNLPTHSEESPEISRLSAVRPRVNAAHTHEMRPPDEVGQRSDVTPVLPESPRASLPLKKHDKSYSPPALAPPEAPARAYDAEARKNAPAWQALPDAARDDSAPAIHITIGRIEVRAVSPPQPARRAERRVAPKLSLDDYLKRSGGRRE